MIFTRMFDAGTLYYQRFTLTFDLNLWWIFNQFVGNVNFYFVITSQRMSDCYCLFKRGYWIARGPRFKNFNLFHISLRSFEDAWCLKWKFVTSKIHRHGVRIFVLKKNCTFYGEVIKFMCIRKYASSDVIAIEFIFNEWQCNGLFTWLLFYHN